MPDSFLAERFREHGGETAIVAPAGSCSYGELLELCAHWDRELERQGVRRGTVVSLQGDFSPSTASLLLALADRAAIIVLRRDEGNRAEAERQDEIAGVELQVSVDREDRVAFETTGRAASHELYDELRRRGHPGVVAFTSGTSGEPKAAVHDFATWVETFEPRRRGMSTLTFLLFDHLGGVRTLLYALSSGSKVVATRDRSPQTVCELIERHAIELLPATPTFFNLLLLSGAHRRHDLSSLRVISYGAEPMPQLTLDRLHAAFPNVKLQQTYGLIEVGPLRHKSRNDGSLWMKLGGDGVDTRVVDGILQIRSPVMTMGYLNAPTPMTADGWFVTGDAVVEDDGYLRILGRASDMVNVGGKKVYPAEVEGLIESMDGVAEAVVYGEPNNLVGQIVCARVTRAAGHEGDLASEVKRFCRERLERFKVPVKVAVVEGRLAAGRVKKPRREGAH